MKYIEIWTRGLSPEEREEVEQTLKNSQKTLDIVRNMVYNVYVDSLSIKESEFDSPGWPYKAAQSQGQKIAYEKLLKLLDISGEDRSLLKTKKKALTDDRQLRTRK